MARRRFRAIEVVIPLRQFSELFRVCDNYRIACCRNGLGDIGVDVIQKVAQITIEGLVQSFGASFPAVVQKAEVWRFETSSVPPSEKGTM